MRFIMDGVIHDPTTIISEDELALHETSRIDSFCLINARGGAVIDAESVIHAGSHLIGNGAFEMGPRSVVTYNCVILTTTADLKYPSSSVVPEEHQQVITEKVTLGRETFVGSGTVIMPGVTLGDGACVAANSYVDEDIPEWKIRFPDGSLKDRKTSPDAQFGNSYDR
jgi:galactoside O-acetyltransferase